MKKNKLGFAVIFYLLMMYLIVPMTVQASENNIEELSNVCLKQ